MNSFIFGVLAILLLTAAAVFGMVVVRHKVKVETLRSYHEVAGYMLSVVGTLYAVLLGFVIVDAMHHMQDVREIVSLEASGLANIFLCAEGLPADRKIIIQRLCHQYADDVINDEWATLKEGKYSQKAFHSAFRLWKEISTLDPKNQREQNIHQQLIQQVCTMTQNHRARVVSATHGVAPLLWFVLSVGGCFTVVFTYFFAVDNVKIQCVMTSLLVVTLSLNLFLVYVFGNPMASDFGVLPGPFKLDLKIFDNFDSMNMPPAEPINSNW